MGYTTIFTGNLKFKREMTGKELAVIKQYFDKDCRDHPEWGVPDLYYMDMEFNNDFTGIQHTGAKKTYDFEKLINLLIRLVKKDIPDFGLKGTISAQGEQWNDRWSLKIKKGKAFQEKIIFKGKKAICPECECEFILEE